MGGQYASAMSIAQLALDTLPSHSTAAYTARLPMHMTENENLSFDVHLYMVSCALALVVQDSTFLSTPVIEQLTVSGTASGFNVKDSVYSFGSSSVIRAEKVTEQCYAAVTLPSRDVLAAVPARGKTAETYLWQLTAHTRRTDGTITETKLSFNTPLKAGTMEIIKVYLKDDGSLGTTDTAVGVTVTLDWKQGTEQELITG